jgi:hypothetical protein
VRDESDAFLERGVGIGQKSRERWWSALAAIVGPMRDDLLTVFVVIHENAFEAFGKDGRRWKTGTIGHGAFRKVLLERDEIVG